MSGSIKHRHQTALAAGSSDVDRNEWNDSLVMAGGVDGQVATRDTGSSDGWSWQTPAVPPTPPATGLVLLDAPTNGPTTLDFTTQITSLYDLYIFELVGIVPSVDANLNMTVSSNNGGAWASSNYKYGLRYVNQNGSVAAQNSGAAAAWPVFSTEATAPSAGMSGTIKLFAPLNATYGKIARSEGASFNSDANQYAWQGGFYYASASIINAVRFQWDSSATFAVGTIRCYGVSK